MFYVAVGTYSSWITKASGISHTRLQWLVVLRSEDDRVLDRLSTCRFWTSMRPLPPSRQRQFRHYQVQSGKGTYILDWPHGCLLPDSHSPVCLRITLNSRVNQFGVLCFGLSTPSQVFTRVVFTLVSKWATRNGGSAAVLPRQLTRHSRVDSMSGEHWELLGLCKDMGIIINWEKSDLELTSRAQYLGILIDSIREKVSHLDSLIVGFQEVEDSFLHLTCLFLQRCDSRSQAIWPC